MNKIEEAEKFLEQGCMFDPRDEYHYYTQKGTTTHIHALIAEIKAKSEAISVWKASCQVTERENELLREVLGGLRENFGEYDGIHDCCGKSCSVCLINKTLKEKS